MKKFVVLLGLLLGLAGCDEVRRSEPLVEDGVVVQTIYRPYHVHHTTCVTTTSDSKGNVSLDTYPCDEEYSEQHWVVFACQHGEFAVSDKDAWSKVSPGMKVKIQYRQLDIYRGKDEKRAHVGTDFEFETCWPADGEWNADGVKPLKRNQFARNGK